MRNSRRLLLIATGIALCGALSGCDVVAEPGTSISPAPTTSAETSTPAPAPQAAALTFSGSAINAVDGAGAVLETTAFSAGAEQVVARLTDDLGVAPEVSEVAESCAAAHTMYRWEGVSVIQWAGTTEFQVGVNASSIGGVRLQTPGGYAVGDDVSGFVATLPAEDVGNYAEGSQFVSFDTVDRVVHDSYNSPLGSLGSVELGLLTSILSPAQWSSFLC